MQSEQDTPDQVASISNTSSTNQDTSNSSNAVHVWSWKESPSAMHRHPASSIVGDPSDCWIRYGRFSNAKLEKAYIENQSTGTTLVLDDPYMVEMNFRKHSFKQVNRISGFERDVQRTIDTPKVWCWKEQQGLMWKHNPSTIYGNPSECWITYDNAQSALLESAYLNLDDEVSPTNGFVVNFEDMIQTNEVAGIERQVQRVDVKLEDQDQIVPDNAASAASAAVPQIPIPKKKVWCWQETDGFMWRHDPSVIHGDPSNCWVKYDEEASAVLEDAFQTQPYGIISPREGYNVNLAIMKQINISTGFERDVQRVDEIIVKEEDDDDDESDRGREDITEVQQLQTIFQSKLQNQSDTIDQKLEAMSTKFEERQNAMENELETVRSQLQVAQSELKQTKQERDDLKQEMASMKDCLDGLNKVVEETLAKQSHANASAGVESSGVEEKKRPCADSEETGPEQKRRRPEDMEK